MLRPYSNPKADFQVATGYPTIGRYEERWNVEGEAVGPGVYAVNQQMAEVGPGAMDYAAGWNVTHVPTSYALVAGLPSRKVAVAVAKRIDKLGWSEVEDDDVKEASKKLIALGAIELKTFLLAAKNARVTPAKLEAQVAKWKPGKRAPAGAQAQRAAKKKAPRAAPKTREKPPSRKKAAAQKPPKKKPTSKKAARAKKPAAPPAPPRELDSLAMARAVRKGNPAALPPDQASAKQRCLW